MYTQQEINQLIKEDLKLQSFFDIQIELLENAKQYLNNGFSIESYMFYGICFLEATKKLLPELILNPMIASYYQFLACIFCDFDVFVQKAGFDYLKQTVKTFEACVYKIEMNK